MPNYLKEISEHTTEELIEELSKREGTEKLTVAHESMYDIIIDKDWEGQGEHIEDYGSAVIIVVKD